ncbi:MAG: F0F1 ATP synthase subunit B [Candidatus Magasanikbacteria bacterium]|nr:F0F1 ATP synthase subunit B [Candidatus Magasanikbacteria bacterium]
MILTNIALAAESAQETEATGTTSDSPLAGLGINGTLFIAQLINFALVATIVWFLILKPLTKKMSERQKMIDDSIDNAKKIQDNLNKSEKEYQTRIDQAKVESNKILEKAAGESDVMVEEAKNNAKKEIERLVSQARDSIKAEKETMQSELKSETVNIIISALEKILGEKVNDASDKKMIEDVLKKLK